jgi:tetratricopeptide (TPR) repeat protein
VYADLQYELSAMPQPNLLARLLQLNVAPALVFAALLYVPALAAFANALAADGLGFTLSRDEYYSHLCVLLPLWGMLLLFSAPIQALLPQFLVVGIFGVSLGLLVLIPLLFLYTVWAVKQINYVSWFTALGVFALSWLTLPVFYILSRFLFALPLFIMIPLGYLLFQRLRGTLERNRREADFRRHLSQLTSNAQDADAHHQLGLIHLGRHELAAAEQYFQRAVQIAPGDADYRYFLGRTYEAQERWEEALEQYEETYRIDSRYRLGDIFREVGKAYLNTGSIDKAVEFLEFFLRDRGSDPEGRYWLAVALQQRGQKDAMRVQLRTILEQSRSNPRFFRRENRQWIHRARSLLRQA